jgi:hypothetical protein
MADAPAAAAPAAPAAKAEKQTNCLACNKPLRKIRTYYRDGKYYCTKRCWIKFKNPEKKEENK